MRFPSFPNVFQKDLKLAEKRRKDMSKIKTLMSEILSGEPLIAQYSPTK